MNRILANVLNAHKVGMVVLVLNHVRTVSLQMIPITAIQMANAKNAKMVSTMECIVMARIARRHVLILVTAQDVIKRMENAMNVKQVHMGRTVIINVITVKKEVTVIEQMENVLNVK